MAMTPSMVWKEERAKVYRLQSRKLAIFFCLTSGRVTNLPEGNRQVVTAQTWPWLTAAHPFPTHHHSPMKTLALRWRFPSPPLWGLTQTHPSKLLPPEPPLIPRPREPQAHPSPATPTPWPNLASLPHGTPCCHLRSPAPHLPQDSFPILSACCTAPHGAPAVSRAPLSPSQVGVPHLLELAHPLACGLGRQPPLGSHTEAWAPSILPSQHTRPSPGSRAEAEPPSSMGACSLGAETQEAGNQEGKS